MRDGGRIGLIAALLLAMPLTAGTIGEARAEPACPSPAEMMARVELFFGVGRVSPQAFDNFLTRFGDGFTLLAGRGQWRDKGGRIRRESARLLLIYYKPDATSNAKIEAIRTAYKKRFNQQSVLRADTSACVSF